MVPPSASVGPRDHRADMSTRGATQPQRRRRPRLTTPVIAVACIGALVLSGCSITAKRDAARHIAAAQKKLIQSGTALLSVTVQLALPHGFAARTSTGTLRPGPIGPPRTETVVTNFTTHRALVIPATGSTAKAGGPSQLFDDGIIYQRVTNGPATSHPWLELDYLPLYDNRKSHPGLGFGYNLLSPLWIVDLLKGALTGSIKRVGSAQVDGITTTEFAANFAWDKSLKHTSDNHTRSVQAALTLLGVPSSVVKGRVWLDNTGSIRQMQAAVREKKGRHTALEWQYTIRFASVGQAVAIPLPKTDEVARVTTLGQILAAQSAGTGPSAASSLMGGS